MSTKVVSAPFTPEVTGSALLRPSKNVDGFGQLRRPILLTAEAMAGAKNEASADWRWSESAPLS